MPDRFTPLVAGPDARRLDEESAQRDATGQKLSISVMPPHVFLRAQRVRELLHACLADPACEADLWNYAPGIRAFFLRHAGAERFVCTFDENLKLWVSLRDHIESQVYFHEMQEGDRGALRLLKRALKPGQTFVDVGANVGVWTLIAAKRVGPGNVHAFEPVAQSYAQLTRNLALNSFNAVRAQRLALSSTSGRSVIHVPRHHNLGMATLHPVSSSAYDDEAVELVTLDAYAAREGLAALDWIKLDVEGHELEVLKGARSVLAQLQPFVLSEVSEEHLSRAGACQSDLKDYLEVLGYRAFGLDEWGRVLPQWQARAHENVLFVPAERKRDVAVWDQP